MLISFICQSNDYANDVTVYNGLMNINKFRSCSNALGVCLYKKP